MAGRSKQSWLAEQRSRSAAGEWDDQAGAETTCTSGFRVRWPAMTNATRLFPWAPQRTRNMTDVNQATENAGAEAFGSLAGRGIKKRVTRRRRGALGALSLAADCGDWATRGLLGSDGE